MQLITVPLLCQQRVESRIPHNWDMMNLDVVNIVCRGEVASVAGKCRQLSAIGLQQEQGWTKQIYFICMNFSEKSTKLQNCYDVWSRVLRHIEI